MASHNVSFSHGSDDVDKLLACYDEVLPLLARALEEGSVREHLIGEPIRPLFQVR